MRKKATQGWSSRGGVVLQHGVKKKRTIHNGRKKSARSKRCGHTRSSLGFEEKKERGGRVQTRKRGCAVTGHPPWWEKIKQRITDECPGNPKGPTPTPRSTGKETEKL